MTNGVANLLLKSAEPTSWGWRTAGCLFLLPSASVLLKPGIPLWGLAYAVLMCVVAGCFIAREQWSKAIQRFGPIVPVAAASNLVLLSYLSSDRAFGMEEIVLWYAAGIMWIGLTQSAGAFCLAPLLVVTFLMTTPAQSAPSSMFIALPTVGVMTTIAAIVASHLSRGRRAVARMREGVRSMTAVARTGRVSPRTCPEPPRVRERAR